MAVPAATPSDGYVRLWWVPAIASTAAPKAATEIGAAGSVDLTDFMKESWGAETSVEEVEDWRLSLTTVLATPGTAKTSLQPLVITHKVQVPADPANKAYATLTAGATGFLVLRVGLAVATAAAAAQICDVFPVVVASRDKLPPEQNSQLKAKVTVMLSNTPSYDVAMAA